MSNLITFAGANYNPPLIPAACEAAFCTASTSSNIFIWNHSKQLMGRVSAASGEMASSGVWNSSWASTPSSSSGWQYAGTSQAGPHGHHYLNMSVSADTAFKATSYYTQNYQYSTNYLMGAINSRATGIWVNKTKRDNLCLQRVNNQNTYLYRTQISSLGSGALLAPFTSTGDMTGDTTAGTANGYNTLQTQGLVGYNETTKMWVVGQQVSGASVQVFVYKNISAPSLTSDSTYWSQFNHSAKITVNFSLQSPSDSYDYSSWKIIPLDNGNIVIISKSAGSFINYTLLTGNDGVNSTSWTASSVQNLGITTSYNNTAWQDNLPAFVTYDGKYVVVYTQYYYYFSGWVGYIIRVSDGKRLTIAHNDTTYSYNSVMIGDNKMMISYGTNSDGGSGQSIFEYDIGYLMDRYATGTSVVSFYTQTQIDNPSSSTCYPMIWTMPSPVPTYNRGVF
jgi:hypothetical protein